MCLPIGRSRSGFTVEIPESATPDIYRGKLVIHTDQYQEVALNLAVNVLEPTLPAPKDYSFFLDLWFNPNAIAVEKGVEPWSEKHWKQIDPYPGRFGVKRSENDYNHYCALSLEGRLAGRKPTFADVHRLSRYDYLAIG
ncbi:hypothetical protein NXY00_19520 [Bacteroides sp. BFG-551]|nr:hypothetical protein [Bacteroides sp. BFG-551]